MCITFFVLDADPAPGHFLLVLANNRDEYYDRPTRPAEFWEDMPHCVGGACVGERCACMWGGVRVGNVRVCVYVCV